MKLTNLCKICKSREYDIKYYGHKICDRCYSKYDMKKLKEKLGIGGEE